MTTLFFCALLAASAALPGAAQESYRAHPGLLPIGGIVLYYNTQGPLSFVTNTSSEIPEDAVRVGAVAGRGCQHGLSVPTAASLRSTNLSGATGEGGYAKALRDIAAKHPGLKGIYDVKVDSHIFSILGTYKRVCTEISARGYR